MILRPEGFQFDSPMIANQTQGQTLPFKCAFCGFLFSSYEDAEECELRCVSRALRLMNEAEELKRYER